MNKNFSEFIDKIFENEKLLKNIIKAQTFDEIYDIIKLETNSKISKTELEEFMNKYSNFNQNDLKKFK